jgi:hypothetical protein
MWEDLSPRIGNRPQEEISAAFGEFEIYLGLMGFSFGTPTGNFGSGTEEEYCLAVQGWKNGEIENIQFYFSSADVNSDLLDLDQAKKVRDFRTKIRGDGVLYGRFSDLKNLEARVRSALISDAYAIIGKSGGPEAENRTASYKDLKPYAHMKALNDLMERRPETAINFLAHSGTEHMKASQRGVEKLTKALASVTQRTKSVVRLATDLGNGKKKEKLALNALSSLYEDIEDLLRIFAFETPAMEENFSLAISNFHRAAEIAVSMTAEDKKIVFEILEVLKNLASQMK